MQKSGTDHYHTRQSPDDVRFTKPTIDLNFPGQHEFENIYDVLRALEQKTLQPRSLPSLRVFLHDNQLWTIDNKLLYIYRISPKVRRVSVTFISGVRLIDRFVNENSKSDLERMASPDFFPEVVRTTDALPVVHSSSSQDCVLLPTVAGFKKMEEERISAGKANLPGSVKSFSSRSNSSSKTVASRVSSDNNEDSDESHLTTGSETNSPSEKLPHACKDRNENRTPDSSTNSSVKSYPVQASNNCGSHKKERDPSPDSSTGQICSEYFGESTSFTLRQSTTEAHIRDLFSKIIQKEERPQTPLTSSPCFTRAVVECRDIPVSDTLPPVHTLTEPINCTPRREAAVADDHHLVESKQNMNPLQFRQQAGSPVSPRSNSPEELSKWREVDSMEAPLDMMGSFSAGFIKMNQARSDNKVVTGAEERGPYQQQQVPTNSRRGSPSKKPAETVSHTSSDSSRDQHSRLDRPLSSCGSSAAPVLERPSTCNFPLDGRKNGPLFRLCATSTVQVPDRTNLSPPKARSRAFLTTEKKLQGKLSQEHELEVSKKILLRHMKKAFFSAY